MNSRQSIRKALLIKRRHLSPIKIKTLSQRICKKIFQQHWFVKSQRIAFYFPMKGEVDCMPLIERALSLKKTCFLPVIHPLKNNSLWFMEYNLETPMHRNRYGILEPIINEKGRADPWALDLVFFPVVGFDPQCNRLGMGSGYYDRTFAFIHDAHQHKPKPLLVGLAYAFQEVSDVSPMPWDIRLDKVMTEI